MSTCPSCALAASDPRTGAFHSGCRECSARALAGGPDFWQSSKRQALTPAYRGALQDVFGEQWEAGHAAVKRWAERIAAATREAAA